MLSLPPMLPALAAARNGAVPPRNKFPRSIDKSRSFCDRKCAFLAAGSSKDSANATDSTNPFRGLSIESDFQSRGRRNLVSFERNGPKLGFGFEPNSFLSRRVVCGVYAPGAGARLPSRSLGIPLFTSLKRRSVPSKATVDAHNDRDAILRCFMT